MSYNLFSPMGHDLCHEDFFFYIYVTCESLILSPITSITFMVYKSLIHQEFILAECMRNGSNFNFFSDGYPVVQTLFIK